MQPNVNLSYDAMAPLLKRAQDDFGYANQITVTTEELCELAAVLSKYPRYPNHEMASTAIRKKVVEEMADVIICLEHLYMIFEIGDNEIDAAVGAKLERLERWLDSGKGFHVTTQDREVREYECKHETKHRDTFGEGWYCGDCGKKDVKTVGHKGV